MNRSLTAISRVGASLATRPVAHVAPKASRASIRRMGGGHHDHHDHRVFEAPYEPMGTPLKIYLGVVFGGLGVTYAAYKIQNASWVPTK